MGESRKRKIRYAKKVLLIVVEGGTEKKYFSNYNRERKKGFRISVENTKDTDAVSLARVAERKRRDLDDTDEVWCVFDVDSQKDKALEQARQIGVKNDFKICVSNPCFELWYLLHYGYFDGKMTSREAEGRLRNYIADYRKNSDFFSRLDPKTGEAVKNAERLNKKYKKDDLLSVKSNPSTQVFALVNRIKELKNSAS